MNSYFTRVCIANMSIIDGGRFSLKKVIIMMMMMVSKCKRFVKFFDSQTNNFLSPLLRCGYRTGKGIGIDSNRTGTIRGLMRARTDSHFIFSLPYKTFSKPLCLSKIELRRTEIRTPYHIAQKLSFKALEFSEKMCNNRSSFLNIEHVNASQCQSDLKIPSLNVETRPMIFC